MGFAAAVVASAVIGAVSANKQAHAAQDAAAEQARAIREAAEKTRQQSEAMANAASAQQAAERTNAAERAKQEAAARDTATQTEEVKVDVGPKDAGVPVSRKRAKFQVATDPAASLRI